VKTDISVLHNNEKTDFFVKRNLYCWKF